jgi:hypothetical protein
MQGIQAVNTEHPDACTVHAIIGVRGERVATLDSPDGLLDIVRWEVLAVRTAIGMLKMRAGLVWYTLEGSIRQSV